MSITPKSPAINQQGWVQTWVTSQWKNPSIPGQLSAEINTVANTPALLHPLLDILSEQDFGSVRTARIAAWRAGAAVDAAQLLAMIASIGKGRLGARLAKKAAGLKPPPYIESAITSVVAAVQHA